MVVNLRDQVRLRAGNCCEYCQLPQQFLPLVVFHIDHIIPKQHGGSDQIENRCLACHRCNAFKGPNLSGIDPVTGKIIPLFHPRRQRWARHFRWDGTTLVGRTRAGRATIEVLAINAEERIILRQRLMEEGVGP